MICTNSVTICKFVPIFANFRRAVDDSESAAFSAFRIFIRYRHCANIEFPIFLGVFFGQGSRPRMWASTPWAICRTDRLSTIDLRAPVALLGVVCGASECAQPQRFLASLRCPRIGIIFGPLLKIVAPKIQLRGALPGLSVFMPNGPTTDDRETLSVRIGCRLSAAGGRPNCPLRTS